MRPSRRLRRLIFALLMYMTMCSVAGIYLADATLHPPRRPLTQDDASAFQQAMVPVHGEVEDVSITAQDGMVMRGWMVRPAQANGNVALLLHGLGDNRLGMTGYSQLLLAHGYTVLLPDARAHGVRGGDLATYGLIERNDIRQWVDLLLSRTGARCVYGMGESMGASQLLEALEVDSRFCAVVAESPFANFREIAYDRMGQPFHAGPWVGRTILRPLVEVAFLRARWKYHVDMEQVSPMDAIAKSPLLAHTRSEKWDTQTQTPVLLIHGKVDSNIPVRHSELILEKDPKVVLWEVPGADHCGAIAVAPKEFAQRVIDWFSHPAALSAVTTH